MSSLLRLEQQRKRFLKVKIHFEFAYFSFFLCQFGTEMIVMTPGSSLKNHTRFQTKLAKQILYLFSDQNAAKLLRFGAAHTYMTYIKDYLPGHMVGKIQEWQLLPHNHILPFAL